MECIILAGGLGTRLRNTIGNYPKCMAEVDGNPFLQYILTYLRQQGVSRVILSLGYKHEIILDWLAKNKFDLDIDHVIETEPLGTGGGIALAIAKAQTDNVFVVNGDTMFRVDMSGMLTFHTGKQAATTLALKEMHDFNRYGLVNTDAVGTITSFEEKKQTALGFINGGVYVIDRNKLKGNSFPEKWSFEKDYLEPSVAKGILAGYKESGYFIDIGIPEDYSKAQTDFKEQFRN
ncbi:MAG: D-mannose-1-phosphate guanyltransferase [Sphingobacteriales bacterium]|nr:MAG: D-mannose-1-phosphate guanyltransferase [Sphingobacteriales bacterium]